MMAGLAWPDAVSAGRDELRDLLLALPPVASVVDPLAPPSELRVVERAAGYVVKKDLRGDTHFLLIPFACVSGIEDAALREAGTPHYFEHAWRHRDLVAQADGAPLRDEQIGIVVNPLRSRSQDHLHLHINRIAPELASQLAAHGPTRNLQWEAMAWNDRVLHVIRVPQSQFARVNPFRLFDDVAALAGIELEAAMLLMTAGADGDGEPVFYLMAGRYGEQARGGWDFENLMVHQPPVSPAS